MPFFCSKMSGKKRGNSDVTTQTPKAKKAKINHQTIYQETPNFPESKLPETQEINETQSHKNASPLTNKNKHRNTINNNPVYYIKRVFSDDEQNGRVSLSPGVPIKFELNDDLVIVGRDPNQCQLILNSTRSNRMNVMISRKHCQFIKLNGSYWIQDLKSTNGVYVNNKQVIDKTKLNDGDIVRFGKYLIGKDSEFVYKYHVGSIGTDNCCGDIEITNDGRVNRSDNNNVIDATKLESMLSSLMDKQMKKQAEIMKNREIENAKLKEQLREMEMNEIKKQRDNVLKSKQEMIKKHQEMELEQKEMLKKYEIEKENILKELQRQKKQNEITKIESERKEENILNKLKENEMKQKKELEMKNSALKKITNELNNERKNIENKELEYKNVKNTIGNKLEERLTCCICMDYLLYAHALPCM